MLVWFQENIGSIVVVMFLLAVVFLIVRGLILDMKAGRHICGGSCGSGCSGCPMQRRCHGK